MFRAWLVIDDKNGKEIARAIAFEVAPSDFAFVPNMGTLQWTTNQQIVLLGKRNGRKIKSLRLSTGSGA
jgi:hypothetical protein